MLMLMLTFAACGMGNRQTSSVWKKNEDTLLVIAMLCLHVPKILASPATGEGLYSLDEDQQQGPQGKEAKGRIVC